ncbi:hypothetical protein [Elioraea sp.]|uniref:hypothetical protein n=1 Tax=Elioraea sp. TaxID=2185103 RepID=UPI003F707F3E
MTFRLAVAILALSAAPALAQATWPAPAGPGLQRLVIPPAADAVAARPAPSERKSEIPPAPRKLAVAPAAAAGPAAAGLAAGGLAGPLPLGLLAAAALATAAAAGGTGSTVTTR